MDKKILNEIQDIKYLVNYDRTKTLNEQSETPFPTPTPTPTPTPVPGGNEAKSFSKIELGGPNDPYQYKFEDDGNVQKYYYAKKGQNDWKQSTNPRSVEAIKKNIFKIN